jgi:predicted RNA-binding Zn ribbon-like protein
MSPVFLGSHPATDFLNSAITPNGQPVEFIGSGGELVDWLVAAGLLEPGVGTRIRQRFGAAELDAAAAQAREYRDWARAWVRRWRDEPHKRYEREFARLNQLLAQANTYREVVWADGAAQVAERTRIESTQQLIAVLAMSLALLLTQERPELVKQCAGAGCSLCFLDRTKGHRRLFCSAAGCGNRAKVAAFRERQAAASTSR